MQYHGDYDKFSNKVHQSKMIFPQLFEVICNHNLLKAIAKRHAVLDDLVAIASDMDNLE